MPVTVIGHFMPAFDDRLALFWPVFHHPCGDEEGRRNTEVVEQIQQAREGTVRAITTETEIFRLVPDRAIQHGVAGRAVEVEGQRQAGCMPAGPGGLG